MVIVLLHSSPGSPTAVPNSTDPNTLHAVTFPSNQGGSMKKLFKLLFVVIVASVIAAAVASVVSKKKLSTMSDEEIREFLSAKIGTKVGDDQLASIQDAVIAGVRKGVAAQDATQDHGSDAVDAATDIAAEAADTATDLKDASAASAGDAAEAVVDSVTAIGDDAKS